MSRDEGIITQRRHELQERRQALDRSEEELSTGLVGPLMLDAYFAGAFVAGVAVDALKAAIGRVTSHKPQIPQAPESE